MALTAANARLAAREAALPGLATLLDPDAMAERLRARWPEVRQVELVYIRHKPGQNSLVLYRVTTPQGVREFFARTFRNDADGKLEKARRNADAAFDDIDAVVFAFPNDPDLPSVSRIGADATRERLLSRILKQNPEFWSGQLTGIAYKPMRRYVARLEIEDTAQAVVKFHSEAEFPAKAAIAKIALDRDIPVLTPKPLGASTRHCAIAYEWINGEPLDAELANPEFQTETATLVGEAIAALHRNGRRGLPMRDRGEVLRELQDQAATIAALIPEHEPMASATSARIARGLSEIHFTPAFAHGDFSAAQILRVGGRVAVIDFDEAHVGDPALDIGHFIAQLEHGAIAARWPWRAAALCGSGLLEGYAGSGGGFPIGAQGIYVAWGLFRLALEPFRRLEPDWPAKVTAILDRAAAMAEGRAEPLLA